VQLQPWCRHDEQAPVQAEDLEGLVMRRHEEAAQVVIASLDTPNAVLAESLLGLARGWDAIETSGRGIGNIANIANQIVRTLKELGVDDDADVWDQLVEDLTK
jgi:hypothetical protein